MSNKLIYNSPEYGISAEQPPEIPRNIERLRVELKQTSESLSILTEKLSSVLIDDAGITEENSREPSCTRLGGDLTEIASGISCLRSRINCLIGRAKL